MNHLFGLVIEGLVAVLLIVTIGYCILLNKRLQRLKADEQSLKATIAELITATEIAERAIGGLKHAVRDVNEDLGSQLSAATEMSRTLTRQLSEGDDVLRRLAAERALIPVQPSPYDLWASAEMVALIREAQVFRPALRAAFVINRRVSTTVIGREARQALAEQPLPALRSEVHQRIVFADSVTAGRLARETAPDSAAAREITALVDELLRWPS